MTSGMIAKYLLHVQAASVASFWGGWLQTLLPWSSVATCLLMARFLYLVWPRQRAGSAVVVKTRMMWLSWTALLTVVVLSPGFIPFSGMADLWSAQKMLSAIWPITLGAGLAVFGWLLTTRGRLRLSIPSGDMLVVIENHLWPALLSGVSRCDVVLLKSRLLLSRYMHGWRRHSALVFFLDAGENGFRRWTMGTMLFLVLAMVFMLLAWQTDL